MLAFGLSTQAHAADCTDLSTRLDDASAAYDDAEIAETGRLLDKAIGELACQERLLDNRELAALFQFRALVALSAEEQETAVLSILRSVAAAPDAPPAPESSPELISMFDKWSRRLEKALVDVRVQGAGSAWVDGREVKPGRVLRVVEGEHLIQYEGTDGVEGEVRELSDDHVVATLTPVEPEPEPAPQPVPAPAPVTPPPRAPAPPPVDPKRRGRPGWIAAGLTGATLGGGAILAAFMRERSFTNDPYNAESYDGCLSGSSCYARARANVIRKDATVIRALYGAGYGLSGAGVVVTGIGALLVRPDLGGAEIELTLRW